MSHYTGSIAQVVQQDFGAFVSFGGARARKDLIQSFMVDNIKRTLPDGSEECGWGLCVVVANRPVFVLFDSREDAEREAEKLDWIFKRDEHAS